MTEASLQPTVAIIILNWNNPTDTLACLRSVMAIDYPPDRLQIIVVDNGSNDDSVTRILAVYPDVILIATNSNMGYAGGNNVGIRHALAHGADSVLILNNDVLVQPDLLVGLLQTIQDKPCAGVVTPLIADAAHTSRVWAAGAQVNWKLGTIERIYAGHTVQQLQTQRPFEVEIAPGSAMLVRRDVFDRIGLMDVSYFLYFEEADWCLKARNAGFSIFACPSSLVWHKVSATLGQSSPITDYYMARNQWRFIVRHWSGLVRVRILACALGWQLLVVGTYTAKSHEGRRTLNRNARFLGLRDAVLGRSGEMGRDVKLACGLEYP